VRTLSHCHIAEERGLLKMSFVGDGFLYNMVRIIAGTLVTFGKSPQKLFAKNGLDTEADGALTEVGKEFAAEAGKEFVAEAGNEVVTEAVAETVRRMLSSQDRTRAGDTLPAHGLVLRHVEYQSRLTGEACFAGETCFSEESCFTEKARRPSAVFCDLPSSVWEEHIVMPRRPAREAGCENDSDKDSCLRMSTL
jgi:hypothetical protein